LRYHSRLLWFLHCLPTRRSSDLGKVDVVLGQVKAGSPQFDLPHRLFAGDVEDGVAVRDGAAQLQQHGGLAHARLAAEKDDAAQQDRKSTRLNSSHVSISYAVFCL